jgi:large subunit ribosomal protein L13
MKTYSPKARDVRRAWYVVDADGAVLGRLASEVAKILRGKHKPTYAPHMDLGDHVVVVNAGKIRLTGEKAGKKIYYHHSRYPGGLREVSFERLLAEQPERAVERAIQGMLPHTRLGRQMARKLSVYAGPEHPHEAQKPVPLRLGEVPGANGPAPAAGAPTRKKEES